MDIYDSDSSVKHDIMTASDDINRHLEEYAADPVESVPSDAEKAEDEGPVLEDEEDRHWGFIMDWGPF